MPLPWRNPRPTGLCSLAHDSDDAVVVDTSVAINLNATGCAAPLLGALPFGLVLTDSVAAELRQDRRSGRNDAGLLASLIQAGLIRVVSLGDAGQQMFASLVIGPASDTLDDGEASTLAYAAEHDLRPVIDERKALRICVRRFPRLRPMSTVDLLMQSGVLAALGREGLADAVFQALRAARMRVPPAQVAWVVRLIGAERAALCPSLPAVARRP